MKSEPKTTVKKTTTAKVSVKAPPKEELKKPVSPRSLPIDYSQPIVRVSREQFTKEIEMAVKRASSKLPGDMQLQIAKLLTTIVSINTRLIWDHAKEIITGDPLPDSVAQELSHLKMQLACISTAELLIVQNEIKKTTDKLLKGGIKLAIALL